MQSILSRFCFGKVAIRRHALVFGRGGLYRPFSEGLDKLDKLIDRLEKNTGTSKPNIQAKSQHSHHSTTKPESSVGSTSTTSQKASSDTTNETTRRMQTSTSNSEQANSTTADQSSAASQNQKPNQKKPAQKSSAQGTLSLTDAFNTCELLVGEIISCQPHPESDKLYVSKIKVSEDPSVPHRTILSALRDFVTHSDMAGKVIVFANLKPRKIAGIPSEGMILCASKKAVDGEGSSQVKPCRPDPQARPGDRIVLSSAETQVSQVSRATNNPDGTATYPSNSAVEKVLSNLKTDDQGNICFDGKKLSTSSGSSLLPNIPSCQIS